MKNPSTAKQEETAFGMVAEILALTYQIENAVLYTKGHIEGAEPCGNGVDPEPDCLLTALRMERSKLNDIFATVQKVRDLIY
jgi:hypothetical protein